MYIYQYSAIIVELELPNKDPLEFVAKTKAPRERIMMWSFGFTPETKSKA